MDKIIEWDWYVLDKKYDSMVVRVKKGQDPLKTWPNWTVFLGPFSNSDDAENAFEEGEKTS